MDSVDKLMVVTVVCIMAALAAYEHGMVCTPAALCIGAVVCTAGAIKLNRDKEKETWKKRK